LQGLKQAAEKGHISGEKLEKHTSGAEQAAEKVLDLNRNRLAGFSRG